MAMGGGPCTSFPLSELPRDVLVSSLGLLSAPDLAKAGAAARIFLLVAREVQRRPELVTEVGKPDAVLAAMGQRLVATPTMGFLFGTGDLAILEQAFSKRLPAGCQLIGASTRMLQALVPKRGTGQTATELRQEGEEGQITLMLGSFPDAEARAFHLSVDLCMELSGADTDAAAAAELLKRDLPTGDDWKTVVLLPLPMRFHPVRVLKAYQRCCPNAAIIGGAAGEQLLLHALGKTRLLDSGVVGLAIRGEVPLTGLVSRGCQPLSPAFRARGAHIEFEDDNDQLVIPELEAGGGAIIKPIELAIKAQEQMDRRFGMFSGVRLQPDTGYILEDIDQRSFHPGGGLRLAWERKEMEASPLERDRVSSLDYCEVRLFQLHPAACKADLKQLLGFVRNQCEEQHEEVLGSLMFTCGGRGARFFGGEDCADAKCFQEAFPSVPLVGFWAGGEIGPQAFAECTPSEATRTGNAAFQGFTAVFGIFRAPKPSRGTFLTILGDDEIPAKVGGTFSRLAQEARERGNAAFRSGDHENAAMQYSRAVDLSAVPSAAISPSERATILSNRAAAHLKKDLAAALRDAEAAVELDPGHVKAHYRKAQAFVGLGRTEEATASLRTAADLFPQEKAIADLLAKVEKRSEGYHKG